MQATSIGTNRTGATGSGTRAMAEAVNEFSPIMEIDTAAMEDERLMYINESDTVGSIPPPLSVKGAVKSGVATLKGGHPTLFFDKIGERIAFERAGARLYEALITKYQAVESDVAGLLPSVTEVLANSAGSPMTGSEESAGETLERIHAEELAHFKLLCDAMEQLGGDPTAVTPCADVTATASMGLVQVLTDPRTTFAQCLNAMLMAELADNAGWELLTQLAESAGENELASSFRTALVQEQEHLAIVKNWLSTLMAEGAGTPAV